MVATFSFRPFNAGPARPTESAEAGHVKEASLRMAAAVVASPLALVLAKSVVAPANALGFEERLHPAASKTPDKRTQAKRYVPETWATAMPPVESRTRCYRNLVALNNRRQLVRSLTSAVLEHNLSSKVAAEFKLAAIANVVWLSQLVVDHPGELGEHDAFRFAAAAAMVTGAVWTHAQPSAAMLAATPRAERELRAPARTGARCVP